ncbi:MAG: hypothetical protein HQK54_16780 [Oligoflexales bacterium]|nr:hypothetical protein [Oligoflexales bacterium]
MIFNDSGSIFLTIEELKNTFYNIDEIKVEKLRIYRTSTNSKDKKINTYSNIWAFDENGKQVWQVQLFNFRGISIEPMSCIKIEYDKDRNLLKCVLNGCICFVTLDQGKIIEVFDYPFFIENRLRYNCKDIALFDAPIMSVLKHDNRLFVRHATVGKYATRSIVVLDLEGRELWRVPELEPGYHYTGFSFTKKYRGCIPDEAGKGIWQWIESKETFLEISGQNMAYIYDIKNFSFITSYADLW